MKEHEQRTSSRSEKISNFWGVRNFSRINLYVFFMLLLSSGQLCAEKTATKPSPETELKLREWRLLTDGVCAQAQTEYAGRKNVLKVNYSESVTDIPAGAASGHHENASYNSDVCVRLKPQKTQGIGELCFTSYENNNVGDPIIPPHTGITAKSVILDVFPLKRTGKVQALLQLSCVKNAMELKTLSKDIMLDRLPQGKWSRIVMPVETSLGFRLGGIKLRFLGDNDASCELYVADAQIVRRDGSTYEVLNLNPPLLTAGMENQLKKEFRKELPKRNPIFIGMSRAWPFRNSADISEIGKFMSEYLPEHDVVFVTSGAPEPFGATGMPKLPSNLFHQMQTCSHNIRYASALDAMPKNAQGKQQDFRFNSICATNPVIRDLLKDFWDYAAMLGINNFKQADYVWPYKTGRWGYDDATVAAFREDLAGMDEGLTVLSETGDPLKTIHFWDYFKDYHGMVFFPADMGLKNWSEFIQPSEKEGRNGDLKARRRFSVYTSLCSYEWLRQAQRYNQWAKAYQGSYEYILNGEGWVNAGDYVYLARLRDSGRIYPEFFDFYPAIQMEIGYRNYGCYLRTGKRLGKNFGYCTEFSIGTYGMPYWDPKIAYVVSYSISALGFESIHYDMLRTAWKNLFDDKKEFKSWIEGNLFMSMARAFRQAKQDKAVKPAADEVLNLFPRSVGVEAMPYGCRSKLTNWTNLLLNAEVNYEQTDALELPLMLDRARVVFNGAPVTRKDIAQKLEEWLARGGKTLVMHSSVPYSIDEGRWDLPVIVKENMADRSQPLFKHFSPGGKVNGRVVMKQPDGKPLLTVVELPKESRIYYLHPAPMQLSAPVLAEVMETLTKDLSLPMVQENVKKNIAVVTSYQNGQCLIFNMWNRTLRDKAEAIREQWTKEKWHSQRGPIIPNNYLFKYEQPGASCSAVISVKQSGAYRIYRFLANSETTVNVKDDGKLTLQLDDALADIFYAAPDSPEFRKFLEKVKADRAKTDRFLVGK